jgi:hypothetical protein
MTSRLIATSRCTARSPRHTSSPSSTASLRSLLTRSYATPSPQPRPKPTPYIPTSPDAFPRFGTTFIALPLPAQIYTQPFQFSPSTALRRLNYAAIKHTAFLKKDMRPPMLGFAWLRSLKALWNAYVMGNKPKMLVSFMPLPFASVCGVVRSVWGLGIRLKGKLITPWS